MAAEINEFEGIRQGLADVKKGRVRPAREVLKRFGANIPYPVRLTGRALRDLEAIYEFIAAEASERAFARFNGLAEAIYSLAQFPERGAITVETRKTRKLVFGKKPGICRIIYAMDRRNHAMNVIPIPHGGRYAFKAE